jgi:hypothetical protein
MAILSLLHVALRHVAMVVTLSMVVCMPNRQTVAAKNESENRTLLIDQSRLDDPMKIVGFTVNGTTLTPVPDFRTEDGVGVPGVSVQASDEAWLKNSFVQIQNVNRKAVDGVWITLDFPEASVGNFIQLGSSERRLFPSTEANAGPDKSALTLNQGQTLEVPLGANYEATKSVRDKQSPNGTSGAKVRIEMVFFSDGTAWTQGSFLRPDPNKPGKFIRICPSEFYAYSPRN